MVVSRGVHGKTSSFTCARARSAAQRPKHSTSSTERFERCPRPPRTRLRLAGTVNASSQPSTTGSLPLRRARPRGARYSRSCWWQQVSARSFSVVQRGRTQRAVDVPPSFVSITPSDASWTRSDETGITRVRLDRGELDIHVTHTAAPHEVVVLLPDGELDDVGTTFHVKVDAGSTVAVSVSEGRVVLRRFGDEPISIGAGGSWVRPSLTAATSPSASVSDAPPPAAASAISLGSTTSASIASPPPPSAIRPHTEPTREAATTRTTASGRGTQRSCCCHEQR